MSELKVDKVSPRSGTYLAVATLSYKNIIINGDMSIAQRGTSETGAGTAGGLYQVCDRWKLLNNNLGTFTVSQSTDVPSEQGFSNSLKWDCTTADASPAAGDYLVLEQRFEGQNLQYLKKGTSSAESLTLSFWVKSAKTGTYIVGILDNDNNRNIVKSYTINTADTWEKKTITFAGDTTGTLDNDANLSLYVQFWLGAGTDFTSGTLATSWEAITNPNRAVGQVNLADNTANDWYITGVQLEAGTTASDFEFLPYDVNLQRCYRYFQMIAEGNFKSLCTGALYTSGWLLGIVDFETKRAVPSIYQVSGTNYFGFNRNGANDQYNSLSLAQGTLTKTRIQNNSEISGTAGQAGEMMTNNASTKFGLDAEL